MWNRLKNSKTFWAALATIVAAVGGYLTGEIALGTAFQAIVTALLGICLRDGIAKTL